MLKKFLKFLRGGSENSEHLEGSYLDELLDRVRPRVAEQLEECPEHDAMPLLVAEILREVTEERFDEKPRCPVVDAQSPPLNPPPAPDAEKTDVAPPPAPDEPPEAPEGPAGESDPSQSDESQADEPQSDQPQSEDSQAEEPQAEDAQSEDSQSEESQSEESQSEEVEADESEIDESAAGEADTDASEAEPEEPTEADATADLEPSDGEVEGKKTGAEEDEEGAESGDDSGTEGESEADGEAEATDETAEEDEGETNERSGREVGEDGAEEGEGKSEGGDGDGADEDTESDGRVGESTAPEPPEPLEADSGGSSAGSGARGSLSDELGSTEKSVELSPDQAPEQSELDEEADVGGPRVDTEVVLEMGRVFLGMLVENDALPVDLQMSIEEVQQARKLLEGYFFEGSEVEPRARRMLRMVEEKFDEGLFSQARILLQLFDADKQTRIENDRNLFYDEMILRFGIQRRHPVGEDIEEKFADRLQQFEGGAEEFEELLVWLSETIYVTFDVYGRDQRAVERWREISETSVRPGASERLLEVIPPVRWRLLDEYSRPVAEIIGEQLTADYVEEYVTNHVKTCYFILRAVGDTGLEGYLDVFFDWTEQRFDVDGPALMPWIYTETTANERLIDEIFHELYLAHFQSDVESIREEWDRDSIEGAVEEVVEDVAEADLSEIPPGHYDFGRFVLDKLFGVEYGETGFPFKMHRLA